MRLLVQLCLIFSIAISGTRNVGANEILPTLYEYYTAGGINSGLVADNPNQFTLNSKPFVIFSGSFHYFRVVPEYWSRTLLRYKAAGLNAVQIYLPWNLHEEIPGRFDFESDWLNLEKFLQLVKEADMFAVVRPGPYICAEWEFGGLPSWLLRDPQMSVRSNYAPYKTRVKLFWDRAMQIINKYQFTVSGGPVIMLQIENEYSPYLDQVWESRDYLQFLFQITRNSSYNGLIFMSDPAGTARQFPIKGIFPNDSVLQTVNGNRDLLGPLMDLRKNQPGKPVYVSELWTGWFDMWYEAHHTEYTVKLLVKEMSDTLFVANGSLNLYPFIGGTNFGFMNGKHVTTSYDYDAPLTESGNYTSKYYQIEQLYQKLVSTGRVPKIQIPDIPAAPITRAYDKIKIQAFMPLENLLGKATKFVNITAPLSMELLNVGQDYGQQFGFVLYRVEGKDVQQYEINGRIRDRGIILQNYKEIAILEDSKYFSFSAPNSSENLPQTATKFDLLIENTGRTNGPISDMNVDQKGLLWDEDWEVDAQLKLNGQKIQNITIYSLDFGKSYIDLLPKNGWIKFDPRHVRPGPAMYRAELKVNGQPVDTFLRLLGWNKGIVFVNGRNLGRYWNVGPQQSLYIPAPWLRSGSNRIDIFELHKPGGKLRFSDRMIWSKKKF